MRKSSMCLGPQLGAGLISISLALALTGCGGGGAATSSAPIGGSTPVKVASGATALFHVDVNTGQVTITPSTDGTTSRAIFSGTAVGFNSSVLLDQPSTVGLKTLSVSLTNNWALPIGVDPAGNVAGLRAIIFGLASIPTLPSITQYSQVSTFAGNGTGASSNGASAAASFNVPIDVATPGGGIVYVAEYSGNVIRKIQNGYVSTLAGSGTAGGVNGAGTASSFSAPYGIAVNPVDGAIIVTEVVGNRVRRVTPDGRVTTIAGTGAATESDGPGNSATLSGPAGVVVSPTGTIYICDYYANTLRRIIFNGGDPRLPASYTVSTVAGSGAYGAGDGVGTGATFNKPAGITMGPDGTLYVADQANNLIRRVSTTGEVLTIAGTGASTSTDGYGNTATFNSPRGIAWVNGGLVVSERLGNKLRQITVANNGLASSASSQSFQVVTLAGTGTSGETNGSGSTATFTSPGLVAADPSGNLYVTDSGNYIREITPTNGVFPIGVVTGGTSPDPVTLSNPSGLIPSTTGTTPYISYAGSLAASQTTAAQNWNFIVPSGVTAFEFTVTVEADSTALTPAEGAIGVGSTKVNVRTLTGGASHTGYLNGSLASARFNGPEYLAMDTAGDIVTGDQYNNAIRLIGANGMVSTIAGVNGTSGSADGSGTTATFNSPGSVAITSDGNTVYVADTGNHKVRRIAFLGGDRTNPVNWYVTTITGTGAAGGNYSTNTPGNTATLNTPVGLALDSSGSLVVSEYSGNRIRRIRFLGGDPSTATNYQVSLLAGDTGSVSPAGANTDSTGTLARFNHPQSLALDGAGNIYVADQSNYRIRVITPDGAVTTLAGGASGDTPSNTYVDGPGPSAHFQSPVGICVDSAGLVYVADSGDNHIRCVTPAGTVTTLAGTGTSGATDGLGSVATFNNPASIIVSPSGTLYVGSTNDNGIRMIERILTAGTRSALKKRP